VEKSVTEVNIKSLSRNSICAGVLQLWQIGSRLFLTPLIIAKIGLAGYGTWTLLFGICAYVSMFDTSFGFAYTKFTAEYDRKGDYATLSEIIGSGIALITGFGFIVLCIIWFLRVPILQVLNVPGNLINDAKIALLIDKNSLWDEISIRLW